MFDDRIYTFLTLYQEMNYHRTAEKRNMTQPGVTQHIQYLEKLYGVRFFSYEGRRLSRTREAEKFKQHLDSMMAEEKAMREEFGRSPGVRLRIGATKTIGEFVLPPIIDGFLKDPSHSLDFAIDNTRELLKLLEDGKMDFAVVEGVFDKERYQYRLFKKEAFTGICRRDHPFAGREVALEEIFGETLLIRERGSGTRKLLEQAISSQGFTLDSFRRTISLGNFSVLMDLLLRENAITFAYETIAKQKEELTVFSVRDLQIHGEFNFIYTNPRIGEEKIALLFGNT